MVQAGYDYADWGDHYAPEPTRTHKRSDKKIANNKSKKRKIMIKLSVIVFAYALLLVYLCIKSATLGYEIVSLENDINRINTENNRMEFSIAQNASLDIIQQKAITELGMISPGVEMRFAVAAVNDDINPVLTTAVDEKNIADNQPLAKLYASLMLLTGQNNL